MIVGKRSRSMEQVGESVSSEVVGKQIIFAEKVFLNDNG